MAIINFLISSISLSLRLQFHFHIGFGIATDYHFIIVLSFDWIDLIVITNSLDVYQAPATATATAIELFYFHQIEFESKLSQANAKNACSWPFHTIVHPANTKNDKIISLWLHRVYVCYWFFSYLFNFSPSSFAFRSDLLSVEQVLVQSNAIIQLEPHAVQVK